MEIVLNCIVFRFGSVLLFAVVCVSWNSVLWQYIAEHKDCTLQTTHMFYQKPDMPYATDCARLCTDTTNCIVFQYDATLKICSLFSYLVPYESSCNPGSKVNSYRRYKVGCGGHGYVYNNATGLCVSYDFTISLSKIWDIQKTRCEDRGQSLMIVDTIAKLRFLQDIIKSADSSIGLYHYFIGGRRINGTFKWINGDDMPTSLDYWYYNPIAYDGTDRECVAIGNSYYYNYKLYAHRCHNYASLFFCESQVY